MGAIGVRRKCIPVASAIPWASSIECSDEYLLGIATPFTRLAPSASIAIAATRAESIPPESPRTTDLNPFLPT